MYFGQDGPRGVSRHEVQSSVGASDKTGRVVVQYCVRTATGIRRPSPRQLSVVLLTKWCTSAPSYKRGSWCSAECRSPANNNGCASPQTRAPRAASAVTTPPLFTPPLFTLRGPLPSLIAAMQRPSQVPSPSSASAIAELDAHRREQHRRRKAQQHCEDEEDRGLVDRRPR